MSLPLHSVKQQTTAICSDRPCLSNGPAESHTGPQDGEEGGKKTGGREGERERGERERGRERGREGERAIERSYQRERRFFRSLYKYIGRVEKHLGGVGMCTFMAPCLCAERI